MTVGKKYPSPPSSSAGIRVRSRLWKCLPLKLLCVYYTLHLMLFLLSPARWCYGQLSVGMHSPSSRDQPALPYKQYYFKNCRGRMRDDCTKPGWWVIVRSYEENRCFICMEGSDKPLGNKVRVTGWDSWWLCAPVHQALCTENIIPVPDVSRGQTMLKPLPLQRMVISNKYL